MLKDDKSICAGVLCDMLVEGNMEGYCKTLDINGEEIVITVAKI